MTERELPETPRDTLSRYAATLRRWWPLAVAIVVIAGLVGYAAAAQRPKSYVATAKVLLGQQRQVDALLGTTDYSPDPERELNTGLELITLEPIAERVRASLGLRESSTALVSRVTPAVDRNSSIVAISVRDARAARAAEIANAFAVSYRAYRTRTARAGLREAIAAARARVPELGSPAQRAALRRGISRLEAAEPFQTGGVQVVRRATAASAIRHPNPLVSGLVGTFLGLLLAALTIIALTRTDSRVTGDGQLEDITGRPVVARIPRPGAKATDALVTLALSLARGRAGDGPARVVLLTSAGNDEGTPEVAVGLARALGMIGVPAITIEADLRAPVFAERLGAGASGGLAAILAGEAELDRELLDIGRRAFAVPAGATEDLPQALLAGDRMAATVEQARARAGVVLLAAGVGDSIALVPLVDDVLLVVRDGVARPADLRRAVRALTDAGIPPKGIVATVKPGRRRFPARGGAWRAPGQEVTAAHGATSEVTVG